MKRIFAVLIFFACLLVPLSAFAQSNASIQIVKPGDRRNVELGIIPVTVALTNANADMHWQIFVDGVPTSAVMPASETSTTVDIPKPTGPHRLKAMLSDAQDQTVSEHEILVMVAPVENHDEIFNRAWFVPAMLVFVVVIIGILILGLRMRPRTAQ
jgi:hypothetical protein